MIGALQFGFMRNALMAGVLVSVACGVIGVFVVVKRIVFISGGIAHAAYGGIGLAYFLGVDPVLGAIVFSLLSALGMGAVERHTEERTDTIIGVLWALGMAIGIIFVDLTPGYKADLMSFLFGSILAVPSGDLWLMLGLDLIIILLVVIFYKELLAISFDETFAAVQGVAVATIYAMLLAMIAFTVVMMMRVVGLIMVIAMLSIPAAISSQFLHDLKRMMILASALGVAFTLIGLWLSYAYNLTSGASIILVAGTGYLLSLPLKVLWGRRARGEKLGDVARDVAV